MHFAETEIGRLLDAFPRLRRRPAHQPGIAILEGFVEFEASPPGMPTIIDEYRVRIVVPLVASSEPPKAYELGGRIPRAADSHVNPDGDLCLGSPIRVLAVLGLRPTLVAFVDKCLVPFLYAASWREQGLQGFPFDELAHGAAGLVEDYGKLFSIEGRERVAYALLLLAKRKRVANKMICPCGCGLRLAKCKVHASLLAFRHLAPRSFYRRQAEVVLQAGSPLKNISKRAAQCPLKVRSVRTRHPLLLGLANLLS